MSALETLINELATVLGPSGLFIAYLVTLFIVAYREEIPVYTKKILTSLKDWAIFYFKRKLYGEKVVEKVKSQVSEEIEEPLPEDGLAEEEVWDEINIESYESKKDLQKDLTIYTARNISLKRYKKFLLPNYQKGLEKALELRLARRNDFQDLIEDINEEVSEEEIRVEFELFDEILKDENKKDVFINEAVRRERSFNRGNTKNLNEDSQKEFCDLLDELTGNSKIIVIYKPWHKDKNLLKAEDYIKNESIDTLFILGRGIDTLSLMNEIRDELQEKYPNLDFYDRQGYEWETTHGNHIGKMIVLKK